MTRRKAIRAMTLALFALATVSCGFHLRGTWTGTLPESLLRLRVAVQGSKLANDPLLVLAKNAIQNDPRAEITTDTAAPELVLFSETSDTQVLSVGSSGRASGYMLRYELSFRVTDAKGFDLIEPQTIRLIRDYTFDPTNVLAKEQEEQDLRRGMQRDAVQQVMRRLSRYKPKE